MSASREDNGGEWCKACERYFDEPHSHGAPGRRDEHVDAVARVIDPDAFGEPGDRLARALVTAAARDILTNPSLVPAMIDALTRHGALRVEEIDIRHEDDGPCSHLATRLVTPWEVAP